MIKVEREAFGKKVTFGRTLGKIGGQQAGPTLIFLAGIHGNEPAGILALQEVFDELENKRQSICGSVYALSGNLPALQTGSRYSEEDLNRLWTKDKVRHYLHQERSSHRDAEQLRQLWKEIISILKTEPGPFYFMDLHTTSSETPPFLTVNDMMLNRKFTRQYPCPIILGIEEYLNGPILSYINEMGYVAFGFEGGQHDNHASVINHKAFVYLSMVFSGVLDKKDINYEKYLHTLSFQKGQSFYEIFYHQALQPDSIFKMKPGFKNFTPIKKNQLLAELDGKPIKSPQKGKVFMPLYQEQGEDGFFLVRKIPAFVLWLSAILRKLKLDRLLAKLPGVSWKDSLKSELIVNKKIARFFARDFFHLLGYRNKILGPNHILMKNREATARNIMYKNEPWY